MLETKMVSKSFGGVVALRNVSIKVNKGELVGIIGPNGAGKTTLYNCLTGFYKPTSGSIFFEGEEITGLPSHKICKKGIARTFQIARPFLNLSVLENIMIGALGTGKSLREAKDIAIEISNFLGLEKYLNQPIKNLNFNYRRRCEMARALATSPKLLLLDEVFAGLNPVEIDEMVECVKKIHEKGLTILMTEHIMRIIMAVAERIIVLHLGQVIAEGSPKEIAHEEKVVEAYLGERIT